MAETSSLNCLSCRVPYQRLHSLNAWSPFSEKALLFTDFCFVAPLPKTRFQHCATMGLGASRERKEPESGRKVGFGGILEIGPEVGFLNTQKTYFRTYLLTCFEISPKPILGYFKFWATILFEIITFNSKTTKLCNCNCSNS